MSQALTEKICKKNGIDYRETEKIDSKSAQQIEIRSSLQTQTQKYLKLNES